MKQFVLTMIASLALGAVSVAGAAGADGKWTFESSIPNKSGAKLVTTLDLKSDGEKLTGTVSNAGAGGRKAGRAMEIQDGKVDGNKVSFNVMQTTRKGETKWTYEAMLDGDTLKGSRMREGGKGRQEFTAKRAN